MIHILKKFFITFHVLRQNDEPEHEDDYADEDD